MSQLKMEVTWELFLEQRIVVHKAELPARLTASARSPCKLIYCTWSCTQLAAALAAC